MAKKRRSQFQVTRSARRDISVILTRSREEFGESASERYGVLMQQALLDIASDPQRPGSKERPDVMIQGARTYHLECSRTRVIGTRVKDPRHFVLYRLREDGVIEVARILHEGADLQRHLPNEYRHDD